MKKIIAPILVLIFAFSFIYAEDIAYVLKNPARTNTVLTNSLDDLGYTYDLISAAEVPETDFSDYKMILLDDQGIENVPVDDYPSLTLDPQYFSSWSQYVGYTGGSQPLRATNHQTDTEITNNLPTEIQVYTTAASGGISIPMYFLYGSKYNDATKITTTEDEQKFVVSTKNSPRRVFFGITETEYWTSATEQLFENSITWIINGESNTPPELTTEIPDIEWEEDSTTSINLNDYFTDADNDTLTYQVYDTSTNQNITITINNNIIYFNSLSGWSGEDWVIFSATDGKATVTSNYIRLIVTPKTPKPIFTQVSDKYIDQGEQVEFTVNAAHPNSLPLTYSAENLPEGATFSNQKFSWTPDFTQKGNYYVTFHVTDGTYTDEMVVKIRVSEVEEPPEFNDATQCSIKNNAIDISIKDPRDGDEFQVGEKVDIEVKIKNKFDESKRFEVETSLYDLYENEVVKEETDKARIRSDDSETFDFEIEIPDNVEEGTFAIYVYAETDGECNSDFVEIDVQREDDALEIEDFQILPQVQKAGNFVEFVLNIKNVGVYDQDATIQLTNEELGLDIKSEEFEIESYGDDDEVEKNFFFEIPEEVDIGEYDIVAEVLYEDQKERTNQTLFVEKSTSSSKQGIIVLGSEQGSNIIYLGTDAKDGQIILTGKDTSKQVEIPSFNFVSGLSGRIDSSLEKTLLIILNIVLGVGSLILFIVLLGYIQR